GDDFRKSPDSLTAAVGKGISTIVIAADTLSSAVRGSGTADIADIYKAACTNSMIMVDIIRVLIKLDLKVRVYLVTAGVDPDSGMTGIPAASLQGVFMTMTAEQPSLAGGVLETDLSEQSMERVCSIVGGEGIPFGAVRDGVYLARRLVHVPSRNDVPPVLPNATYLITGGGGALGMHTAGWLAAKGAGCIVLASRSGVGAEHEEEMEAIRSRGCRVEVFRCDISNRQDASKLMEYIAGNLPALKGVFHAAGVLDDATLPEMTDSKFDRVMNPKVRGALYLHELTRNSALDWFVLYSSASSLLGSGGQANYCAANMALNALAEYRAGIGLPAVSLCWGPWAGSGMAGTDPKRGARLAAGGILELDQRDALAALEKAAGAGIPVVGVMAMDWKLFLAARPVNPGEYLSLFAGKTADKETSSAMENNEFNRILDSCADDRRDRLVEVLCVMAAKTLGLADALRIMPHQPLMEQGFDSLMAVEIRNRLVREFGVDLPASFLFSYPTIDKIADWYDEYASKKSGGTGKTTSDLMDDINSLLR
ncbi:MAG: beta-ketoacyl reductase, partial [Candidatus Latescibacterota bacterium]